MLKEREHGIRIHSRLRSHCLREEVVRVELLKWLCRYFLLLDFEVGFKESTTSKKLNLKLTGSAGKGKGTIVLGIVS